MAHVAVGGGDERGDGVGGEREALGGAHRLHRLGKIGLGDGVELHVGDERLQRGVGTEERLELLVRRRGRVVGEHEGEREARAVDGAAERRRADRAGPPRPFSPPPPLESSSTTTSRRRAPPAAAAAPPPPSPPPTGATQSESVRSDARRKVSSCAERDSYGAPPPSSRASAGRQRSLRGSIHSHTSKWSCARARGSSADLPAPGGPTARAAAATAAARAGAARPPA